MLLTTHGGMVDDRTERRARILASCGAGPTELAELLAYNRGPFDHNGVPRPVKLPLEPEPSTAAWERYAKQAERVGVLAALTPVLPQLHFPIQQGISRTDAYRLATLRGVAPEALAEATGLALLAPDKLRLIIHGGLAGRLPALVVGTREDFVSLVQALSHRNEPVPIPASMGSCTVTGYNNWDRVREYRRAWEAASPASRGAASWADEFGRMVSRRASYQDRFMILSEGPYSDVPSPDVGVEEAEWRRISLAIRLEHEFTHYFTLRVYGAMRNNALDEVYCDYLGIVAGAGRFRADWLLRFLGLESYPGYREGGRLQNYLGDPPLSPAAFRVLQCLVGAAASTLERLEAERFGRPAGPTARGAVLMALTRLTLEDLADAEGLEVLRRAIQDETLARSGFGLDGV